MGTKPDYDTLFMMVGLAKRAMDHIPRGLPVPAGMQLDLSAFYDLTDQYGIGARESCTEEPVDTPATPGARPS